jgi:transposase
MTPLTQVNYQSKDLGHLGMVSAMCKELKIAETIDLAIPQSLDKKVSIGQLVVAMILNGLGFFSRALYLTPKYFADKPVERLIGAGISAEDLNDDALGRALDKIHEFSPTELYSKVAAGAVKALGLKSRSGNLDSTSFHTDGEYNSNETMDEDSKMVQVTKGYSRDHRPELNQIILNMITENQAGIPVFMQTANGNQQDKEGFQNIIKDHISELKNWTGIEYLIADSALYTYETIKKINDQHLFITRVPENIAEAKTAIIEASSSHLIEINKNYSYVTKSSEYGGVKQRWLVVKSKEAEKRDLIGVIKKFSDNSEKEQKEWKKLSSKEFACKEDALKEYQLWAKKLKFITVDKADVIENKHYANRGKPKNEEAPVKINYSLIGNCYCLLDTKKKLDECTGMFILATNQLDEASLTNEQILQEYKSQQTVERGFKFLKNPYFFTASFFVKKVSRMMALLMIMTLCLMVYAAIEYRLRQQLTTQGKTVLDQKKISTNTPTAKWIFECFVGIHVLILNGMQEMVLNLNDQHILILNLLGEAYREQYS